MRKKFITAVAAVMAAVMFCCILTPALASARVCFTAVNDKVLPISEGTMPVFYDGMAYVPYSVFTSNSMGIYYAADSAGNSVMLYSSGENAVIFESDTGQSYDLAGNEFAYPAKWRNGTVFVPAVTVCNVFGFSVSYISGEDYSILRINSQSSSLTDSQFAAAAENQLTAMLKKFRGEDILPSGDGGNSSGDSGGTGNESGQQGNGNDETGEEAKEDDAPEEEKGASVYLCFAGTSGEAAERIVDSLQDYGYRACFFVREDDVITSGDLIRKIVGTGNTLGVCLTEGTQEEFDRTAKAIFEVCGVRTVIACYDPAEVKTDSQTPEISCAVLWNMEEMFDDTVRASNVISRLSSEDGEKNVAAFNVNDHMAAMTDSLFPALRENGFTVSPVNETVEPW